MDRRWRLGGAGARVEAFLAALAVATAAQDSGAGALLVPRRELPLRVRERDVVGVGGTPVTLACVNWYGSHLEQEVPNGLDKQRIDSIAERIAQLGFNCIRLPYSEQMVMSNRSVARGDPFGQHFGPNPALADATPLQVFDATVAALTDAGLLVILNSHVSESKWCCSDSDHEGLWYTARYSEEMWLENLRFLAARYRGNDLVVGFDLRNEIRTADLGVPRWGSGAPRLDWAAASVKGGSAVRAVNPDLLVFISGLHYSQYLCDVRKRPVHTEEALAGHVVYTVHEYSWYGSDLASYHWVIRHHVLKRYLQVFLLVWCLCVFRALVLSPLAERGHFPMWAALDCCRTDGCQFPTALAVTLALVLAVGPVGGAVFHPCGVGTDVGRHPFVLLVLYPLSALSLFLLPQALVPGAIAADGADGARTARFGGRKERNSPPDTRSPPEERSSPEARSPRAATIGAADGDREQDLETSGMERAQEWSGCLYGNDGGVLDTSRVPSSPSESPRARRRAEGALGGRQLRRPAVRWSLRLAGGGLVGYLIYLWLWLGSYRRFEAEVDARWGFLLQGDDDTPAAPIWLGEFGTNTNDEWWSYMMRYVEERRVGFAYWALNGEKRWDGEDESFGIFKRDSRSVRHEWKLAALQKAAEGMQRRSSGG